MRAQESDFDQLPKAFHSLPCVDSPTFRTTFQYVKPWDFDEWNGERALKAFVASLLTDGDYPEAPQTGSHRWRPNPERGRYGWECSECLASDFTAAAVCPKAD